MRGVRPPEQLSLFHPPRTGPQWEGLPPDARRRAVRPLVKMLYEHLARPAVPEEEGRPTDE